MNQNKYDFVCACRHGDIVKIDEISQEHCVNHCQAEHGLLDSIENGCVKMVSLLISKLKKNYTLDSFSKALYRLDLDAKGFLLLNKKNSTVLRILVAGFASLAFKENFPYYQYDNVFTVLRYFNSEFCIQACTKYEKKPIYQRRKKRVQMSMVKYDLIGLAIGLRRLDLPLLLQTELASIVAEPFGQFMSLYEIFKILNAVQIKN